MDQEKLRKQLNIAVKALEDYSTWRTWARPYTINGELGIKQSLYHMGNENGYDRAKAALAKIKELEDSPD